MNTDKKNKILLSKNKPAKYKVTSIKQIEQISKSKMNMAASSQTQKKLNT